MPAYALHNEILSRHNNKKNLYINENIVVQMCVKRIPEKRIYYSLHFLLSDDSLKSSDALFIYVIGLDLTVSCHTPSIISIN